MQLSDLLEGVNDRYLYHGTDLISAIGIIKEGILHASSQYDHNPVGVSLTRSYTTAWQVGTWWERMYPVVFVFDADKIKQSRHKTLTRRDSSIDYDGDGNPVPVYRDREAEEMVVGDLPDMMKYLVSVNMPPHLLNKAIDDEGYFEYMAEEWGMDDDALAEFKANVAALARHPLLNRWVPRVQWAKKDAVFESATVYYFGGFTETPTREQTSKYMRGWCPYFALAAHDVLGHEIIMAGHHFAVRDGDTYIDVRGIMTEQQFRNNIDDQDFLQLSREELMEEIESGLYKCGYFQQSELNKAKKLVKNLVPSKLTESAETGLLRLWHGGKDVESDYTEVKAHGKGRWEHGPGLYLTNDRHTAMRYAKGGRKLYVVDIDLTGAREMEDVEIPLHDAVEFVERNCIGRMRQKIIDGLNESFERRGAVMAINVVYLCLNWEAIPNSKTDRLRQFLIDHGVDYSKVDRYGGNSAVKVYVVINPRIVKKVTPAAMLKERVENGVHLVYHATDWGAEIIADNAIKAKTTMTVRGKKQRGISVTRSKRFAMQFAPLVLGLDRDKLAQRYRIVPHADETIGKLDDHGDARREAEDFILCDSQIDLTPYLYGFWINEEYRTDPEHVVLTKHPLFKGWFPVV